MVDAMTQIDLNKISTLLDTERLGSIENGKEKGNFGNLLTSMIKQIETSNREADLAVSGLATGDAQDLHTVMIAVEKADISLRLALEIRNKLITAYKEIMRMSA